MKEASKSASCRFNMLCISVYSFFKVRDSLVMLLTGIALLSIGLQGISNADITPSGWPNPGKEKEEYKAGKESPYLSNTFSPYTAGTPSNYTPGTLAPRSPHIGIAESSFFKGAEDPLLAVDAEQPRDGGIGEAEAKDVPYDDTLIRNSVGNLYKMIEGAFGALVVVAAGIGTIIAAVVGAYRIAFALFVTAVGAFILRSYVSLFFGTDYVSYELNGGEPGGPEF
jgi:hypothetical protein